jgi:hypothetical protein
MPAIALIAHPLGADLAPLIFDMMASLFLVKVTAMGIVPPATPGTEQGTLRLEIVEIYRGAELQPGDRITVAFSRVADPLQRLRVGWDQWNNVNLEVGAHLLVAAHRLAADTYDPLAAENVDSPGAPEAAELRNAVQLHDSQKPPDRIDQLYSNAILSGEPLLRRYALEAIASHAIIDRLPGTEIFRNAISTAISSEVRLEIALRALEPMMFQEERHADRANRTIVAMLVDGYLRERDAVNRMTWTKLLGSVLKRQYSEEAAVDRTVKESLVRAVDRPQWEAMRDALGLQSQTGPADERELTSEVLAVWLLGLPVSN